MTTLPLKRRQLLAKDLNSRPLQKMKVEKSKPQIDIDWVEEVERWDQIQPTFEDTAYISDNQESAVFTPVSMFSMCSKATGVSYKKKRAVKQLQKSQKRHKAVPKSPLVLRSHCSNSGTKKVTSGTFTSSFSATLNSLAKGKN